jgi:hypothetical protein
MSGAVPPLLQYAFMAWFSLKAQGQLYLYLYKHAIINNQIVYKLTLKSNLGILQYP